VAVLSARREQDINEDERAEEVGAVYCRLARKKLKDGTLGGPACSPGNVAYIIQNDPIFDRGLRYNDFKRVIEWQGEPIRDETITELRLAIGDTYDITPSVALMAEMLALGARARMYHPVRDYLERVRWDGKHRLSTMLATYVGADDNYLHAEIGRRFMISAVARIMNPGCKVDTTIILAGPQGARKSTFFKVLAGEPWFADTALDIGHKDAYLALHGVWLYELAELASMRPRDAETVKAFLSAPRDHYRPPYGRVAVDEPRQVVFVGTTNETGFLNDATGSRRFWPVKVKEIRILELSAARDQLWAEAVHAWRQGERWWLEENGEQDLTSAHEEFAAEDPWDVAIGGWLERQAPGARITVPRVLVDCLEIEAGEQHKGHEMRVSAVLTRKGYSRARVRIDGRREYVWSLSK